MTVPDTIILIPSDPAGPLLAPGVCGSRPPMLVELSRGTWWALGELLAMDGSAVDTWEIQHGRRGLVLDHKSAPALEGWDRAIRCAHKAEPARYWRLKTTYGASKWHERLADARLLAADLGCDIATLDASGIPAQ